MFRKKLFFPYKPKLQTYFTGGLTYQPDEKKKMFCDAPSQGLPEEEKKIKFGPLVEPGQSKMYQRHMCIPAENLHLRIHSKEIFVISA